MKIIYGRAGTGKSEYIFNDIKEKIKNKCSEKIYIITPEQFTFTAEKRLIDKLKEGATTSVEVLSFERMAYRVIKETVDTSVKTNIGKSGKSMIVYEAISKHQKELKFLGKTLENVDLIITQITEFKKHNITIPMLEEKMQSTTDQYLQAKLNDMLIMYKELEDKITENFIDENDVLTLLADNIEKSHILDKSIIYIDEFSGFTKQEYAVIQKLNEVASELYITVCTDDLTIKKRPEADIFYDNKQTVQSLCQICEIDKDKQIKLEKELRFKNNELEHLEKNIYALPYNIYGEDVKNIELFLAENKYTELQHVATNIIKLVRDANYRFRDICVICNDIEGYSSLCKVIFNEYKIPVFIDEAKDITQNIIIKYLLSILDIYVKNWSNESVFNYLKTGLVEVSNIYELENYCIKWGIQGKKWYEERWNFEKGKIDSQNIGFKTENDQINFQADQNKITEKLLNLKKDIDLDKNAMEISKHIYKFMSQNLIQCTNKTDNNFINNILNKEENIEAWNIIVDVLDEIAKIFGRQKMTYDEYSKVLKIGLASKKLGQIPQTQDKLIVGDVNRSKTQKARAVFIIGVNDGIFPTNIGSEGFLNDKDRENLKKENLELAKGTKEKMYEQNFNIYKAFATAEEKLFISYASSDSDGKALRKSLVISKIKKIFPKLKEKSSAKDEILTVDVTFSELLNNIKNPKWYEVYKWYENNYPEKLKKALEGLNYTNVPSNINKENIEKLYGNNLKTSISKLESYESCPFSYYLKYGLKLSDKEKLDIKPIDTGSFIHEVIDEFFKSVQDIKSISQEETETLIDEIISRKISYGGKFTLTAKYRTLVQRLKRVILISMKYIIESLKNSSFDVLGTEVSFGENGNNYPPIEMKLENGKRVSIIGKIDRIDIAKMPDGKYIRIIDYKSSTKDIDLNKVIAGLQLQLITYVDAVCQKENVLPAGALYFTLLEPKILTSNRANITKDKIEELIKQNYKMNGLVLANVNIIKAMDTNLQSGKSDTIPVTLNSNGEINYNRSSTVTREEFEKLQRYTTNIIKKISNQILEGNIELKPYYNQKDKRTPCSYCQYKSICQFNPKFKNNNYKFIQNKNRQDILDEIK